MSARTTGASQQPGQTLAARVRSRKSVLAAIRKSTGRTRGKIPQLGEPDTVSRALPGNDRQCAGALMRWIVSIDGEQVELSNKPANHPVSYPALELANAFGARRLSFTEPAAFCCTIRFRTV